MPYRHGGIKVYPGDPAHGTRWATQEEKELAAHALEELETHHNRIVLVPAPSKNFDGHKIRVQESANPSWYRKFGTHFWRGRRVFLLKRRRVEKALRRVAVVGIVRRNGYEVQLLVLLKEAMALSGSKCS